VQNFVKVEGGDDNLGNRENLAQTIQLFVGKLILVQHFLEFGKSPDTQCESSLSGKQLKPKHREQFTTEQLLKIPELLTHPVRNAKSQIAGDKEVKAPSSFVRARAFFSAFFVDRILTRTTYCGLLLPPHTI
jgi:hypothetical protein